MTTLTITALADAVVGDSTLALKSMVDQLGWAGVASKDGGLSEHASNTGIRTFIVGKACILKGVLQLKYATWLEQNKEAYNTLSVLVCEGDLPVLLRFVKDVFEITFEEDENDTGTATSTWKKIIVYLFNVSVFAPAVYYDDHRHIGKSCLVLRLFGPEGTDLIY